VEQGVTAYFPATVRLISGGGRVKLSVDPGFARFAVVPNPVTPSLSGQRADIYIYTSNFNPGTYTFKVKGEKEVVSPSEPPVVRFSAEARLTVTCALEPLEVCGSFDILFSTVPLTMNSTA